MNDNNQNTPTPENKEISIELTEDIAEGLYSNLAIITHSASEFVFDFVRVMPGLPKAKVKSRIVMTPEHALRLYGALQDNLKQYEAEQAKAFEAAANAAKAASAPTTTETVTKDFPYPIDFNPKGEA